MKTINCVDCGVEFGITDACHAAWLKTGRLFCCPNGHEQLFQVVPAEAKIAELKAKLDDLEKRLALALADNASLRDELSIWHPRSADSRHGDKL